MPTSYGQSDVKFWGGTSFSDVIFYGMLGSV